MLIHNITKDILNSPASSDKSNFYPNGIDSKKEFL